MVLISIAGANSITSPDQLVIDGLEPSEPREGYGGVVDGQGPFSHAHQLDGWVIDVH